MDFGDILEQWDAMQAASRRKKAGGGQLCRKKADAPAKAEKAAVRQRPDCDGAGLERKINPMELWLRRYGTVDKDALAERAEERRRFRSRSSFAAMRIEARIDLHGLTQEDAWRRLDEFVSECGRRKIKKILIVHGKGIHSPGNDPVLGGLVRRFIECDRRLGTSGHPDAKEGGSGATWVVLKNSFG
ncbi:MAG: Smr/MutS family protein [Treponemataceae bacterium]|nr:Smr/MutS family protein [Treponemataceae bacterium]